ncbi:MAG: D-alanyl-D-alanine carboxypeptidase [Deltaproteobacteria bacterium]|nr:MAG: D-alanyl-D-alanine carboxypeptidase [Deltaproteobacteria bacterium]
MSRLVFLFLTAFLLMAAPAVHAVTDPFPKSARAYLTQVGGTTVWAHQADEKLPPASLTKIMTALLVLERANLNATVTVTPAVAAETGHRLRLRVGEKYRVRDLLAAMLIESANDAARALAEHIAGSEARFADIMNARAVQLGLKNTRFTNAAGHHDPGHYTTANDLVVMTEAALARPLFRELVSTVRYEIRSVNGKRRFKLENSNKLLPKYDGMVGVKTGYTPEAGRCLVALAERDGIEVLIVLLRAKNRWNLAEKMLDTAFELYAAGGGKKAPVEVAQR